MSKLAKLQEEKLEQLKMLSSAGRVQLEEALAPETAPKSPALREIVSAEEPEAPATTETSEMLVQKQVRRSVVRGKRLGRPPFAAEMRASTVYLPESVYAQLEALANKSGKKGFKRPGLSETVRAALRLVQSRQWSSEEISQAFAEDVGVGE
jgi:Arc/MetJ-type ribon-helix-helix transcriptional regulator